LCDSRARNLGGLSRPVIRPQLRNVALLAATQCLEAGCCNRRPGQLVSLLGRGAAQKEKKKVCIAHSVGDAVSSSHRAHFIPEFGFHDAQEQFKVKLSPPWLPNPTFDSRVMHRYYSRETHVRTPLDQSQATQSARPAGHFAVCDRGRSILHVNNSWAKDGAAQASKSTAVTACIWLPFDTLC
jgi:hypothetical protein